jgi:hypothetical protein
MLPFVPEISSGIYHLPCFGRLACLPQPHSRPLYFSQPLLDASGSSGRLACHPNPTLSICCFSWVSLRVRLLAPLPLSRGRFSIPLPPPLSVLDYSLLFMFFSFAGGIQSAQGLCWIIFLEVGKGVRCAAWYSPVCSAVSCWQLWSQLAGRNDIAFFSATQCRRLSPA